MPNAYIEALKEFNKGKGGWCIPRKGSEDYKEVMKLKERMMKKEPANVIVHQKVNEIEKKIEKKEKKEAKRELSELDKRSEARYEQIISYGKLTKEKWDTLSDTVKRNTLRSIVDDLPQFASLVRKANPYPDKKSLPKHMWKSYDAYMKEIKSLNLQK